MAESKLIVTDRDVGDVTVINLSGQMVLDDGDLMFRRHVHQLVERGRVRIVLDLGNVTYIDSSGIGMMAAKLNTVRQRGGDIRLLNLSARSQRLFGMLKLLTAFETFEDEGAAVRSFSIRPGA